MWVGKLGEAQTKLNKSALKGGEIESFAKELRRFISHTLQGTREDKDDFGKCENKVQ